MVHAGEQGGFLEDVLSRIAVFTERQDELRNKVVGAMIYPCVLMFAGATVVIFLMASCAENQAMLQSQTLPWVTTALFAVGDFISGHMLILAACSPWPCCWPSG